MTAIIKEVFEALKEAGVSEEKAVAAAHALADSERRSTRIEADLLVLKWMAGFNLAFTVGILFKVLA
ncbi:MAG: integrase [Gammaproteobacteria bacterium]|nr:integrase [Gammaproteobacteria bacterium]